MNNVTLVGRIGKDAEVQAKGKVIKFSLATNRFVKVGENITDWHNITMFSSEGKDAQKTAGYLTKGTEIWLTGSIQYSKYEEKHYTNIVANNWGFCGGKKSAESKVVDSEDEPKF
jgi:single-strand DNA-binding protein